MPMTPENGWASTPVRAGALFLLASFLITLDLAGMVILLPSIQDDLGVDVAGATWIVVGFVLPMATLLPAGVRLTLRHGERAVLGVGLAAFVVASGVVAVAPVLPVLLAGRILQGAAGALVAPALRALIRDPLSPGTAERGQQAQAAGALLGAALGPVLPAALATWISWRAQFALEAAVALALLLVSLGALPHRRPHAAAPPSDPLLLPRILIGSAAVVAVFVAVIEGPDGGWVPYAIGTVVVLTVAGALLRWSRSRGDSTLVELGLLRRRPFWAANAVRALTEFASVGIFLPLSGYLQQQLHHSPLIAGLLLMPVIGGAVLTAPLAEALDGRVDARWLLVPGFLATAAGITWLAQVSSTTPWWFFIAPLAIVGAGTGALEAPADSAIERTAPATRTEAAWQLSHIIYLLGIGSGLAVVSATWQSVGPDTAHGVNTALLICAAAALLGALLSALISNPPPQPAHKNIPDRSDKAP